MTMILTYPQAVDAGPARVGGKAWNMGRLARWGFDVPRGIVLDAKFYDDVIADEHLAPLIAKAMALETTAIAETATEELLAEIRAAINSSALPVNFSAELQQALEEAGVDERSVAVRSSATGEDGEKHAFAGIHESLLNVSGRNAILRAIRACCASLWTPCALAYRRRFAIADKDVRCGVLICEMIAAKGGDEPIAAGVVFTADPSDGRRDRLVIETVAGLGDKLVGGRATPARAGVDIVVDGFGPVRGDLGALPVAKATHLLMSAWRIHWDFGDGDAPQDIEWAFDGEKIFILQTRPITALPRRAFPQIADQPTIWSNANLKEVLPGVMSPLGWSPVPFFLGVRMLDLHRLSGYAPPGGMQILRRFQGRAYLNVSALQYAGYDAWGVPPADWNTVMGGFQPEIRVPAGSPYRGRAGLRRLLAALRLMRVIWPLHKTLPPKIDAVLSRAKAFIRSDLSAQSDAELTQRWLDLAKPEWDLPFMEANSVGSMWHGEARKLAAQYLPPEKVERLLGGLMSGQSGVVSADHAYELHDIVARRGAEGPGFDEAIETWLDTYGHRGFNEVDLANPRWRETPDAIKTLARSLGAAAHDPRTAQTAREKAEKTLRSLPWLTRIRLRWLMRRAGEGFRLREATKSALVATVADMPRHIALEFGRRCEARGLIERPEDFFMLTVIDAWSLATGDWSGRGARELVADRRKQQEAWLADEPPPDVIIESPAGDAAPARAIVQESDVLHGLAASPGIARGLVRKVTRPDEAECLRAGGVLVARATDPGWTPLFLLAQAIVVEIGGYLSHSAIVAREFGLPAVVNVPGVFELLQDGEEIVVDADRGRVHPITPRAAQESSTQKSIFTQERPSCPNMPNSSGPSR
jgi:rifampicin phosphotransferase